MNVVAKGRLLSAFSIGYLLTQVLGGVLADLLGARRIVLLSLGATAACLAVAPAAAEAFGAEGLIMMYFVMGVANGPLFPSCSVMLRDIPAKGRSRAMALVDAGGSLGGCLATALCPAVAASFGWRRLYHMLASVAMMTAAFWARTAVDPPHTDAECNKASQRDHISPSLLHVFCHPGPWALFAAHAAFNYSNYLLNAWLPTMFVERFSNVDAVLTGFYLVWPEVFGIASRIASASYVDRHILQEGRWSLLQVRRGSSIVAFLAQGIALVFAIKQTDPGLCASLLVCAAGAAGLHSCGFKANYLDLTSAHSGVLAGVGNTLASVSSAFGPMITSSILAETPGNWERIFWGVFALNFVGAIIVGVWLSVECLDGVPPGGHDLFRLLSVCCTVRGGHAAGVQKPPLAL